MSAEQQRRTTDPKPACSRTNTDWRPEAATSGLLTFHPHPVSGASPTTLPSAPSDGPVVATRYETPVNLNIAADLV